MLRITHATEINKTVKVFTTPSNLTDLTQYPIFSHHLLSKTFTRYCFVFLVSALYYFNVSFIFYHVEKSEKNAFLENLSSRFVHVVQTFQFCFEDSISEA